MRAATLRTAASMLVVGTLLSRAVPAVPPALAQAPDARSRVYLPLVGHFTRDVLTRPTTPSGPTGTAVPTATTTAPPPTPTSPAPTRTPAGSGASGWTNVMLSRHVTALHFDAAAQRMWVGTTSGLVAWDVRTRQSRTFSVADGLMTNVISAVTVDPQGRVWVGHDLGVSVSEDGGGQHWRAFRDTPDVAGYEVDAIVGDDEGGTWFGTTSGLVRRAPDGRFEVVRTPALLGEQAILSALRDSAGNLWFGTADGGLAYRSADGPWQEFTTADGLPDAGIHSLALDGAGRLWAGTGAGLARHDADGGWTVVGKARIDGRSEPLFEVNALAVGASGEVWLASDNRTLRLPAGAGEAVFDAADNVAGTESIAATPDGAVWFGAATTLVRRAAKDDRSTWDSPDVLPANEVNAIASGVEGQAIGQTWLGTPLGVVGWDGLRGWRSYASSAGSTQLFDMAVASTGRVWMATAEGLLEIDPAGEQWLHQWDPTLPFHNIAALALDGNDRPWIGISPGGAIDPNIAWLGADGVWHAKRLESGGGQPARYINKIAIDADGAAWIGASDGLHRLDPDGRDTTFGGANGPPSMVITGIDIDPKGRVWVGTTSLLNPRSGQYEGGGAAVYDAGTWTQFTTANGLLSNRWIGAMDFDADGGTWFATYDGLSHRDAAGRWTSQTAANGLPPGQVADVVVAADGGIWALVYEPGATFDKPRTRIAHRAPGGGWQEVPTVVGTPPTRIEAVSIAHDPRGGLVLGAAHHAIWQAPDTSRTHAFAGVHLNGITSAAIDASGHAWFGSAAGLARRSPAGSWKMWTPTEGLPAGTITALEAVSLDATSTGDLWLGLTQSEPGGGAPSLGGGVARLSPDGGWKHWTRADGVASNRVNDLALNPGTSVPWVATEPETLPDGDSVGGGISWLAPDGKWTTYNQSDGLADDYAVSIALDCDAVVSVGTFSGISRRNNLTGTWSTLTRSDGLPAGEITALEAVCGDGLWIGTSDGAAHLRTDGKIEVFGLADGLGDPHILSIAVGPGDVWFGHLFHGVSRLTLDVSSGAW